MFGSSKYRNKKALIMCNDMKSCQEDICRLEKILNFFNFEVTKRIHCYPKREIEKYLQKENLGEENLLYIHYSGHGLKRGKRIENEYKLLSTWINPNGSVTFSTEIDDILSKLNCKIILTTDSCHSSTFAENFKKSLENSLIFIGTSKISEKSKTYVINGEPAHGSLIYLFEDLMKKELDINIENIENSKFFLENNIDTKLIIKIF